MSAAAKKKPLYIERSRERLSALGLGHAAEAPEPTLTDVVSVGTTVQVFLETLRAAEADARKAHVIKIKGRIYRQRDLD